MHSTLGLGLSRGVPTERDEWNGAARVKYFNKLVIRATDQEGVQQ